MTLGGEAAFAAGNPARRMFRLSVIVGRVWAALSLYGDIASRFAIVGPFEVSLALLGTEGALLSGFGRDWEEPTEFYGDFGHCYERNLWIRKELIDWPDAAGIKSLAFTLGGRMEDAWGIRQRRFLFCKGPQAGEFDPAKYRWW